MIILDGEKYSVSFKDKRGSHLHKKSISFDSRENSLAFARRLIDTKNVFDVNFDIFDETRTRLIKRYKTRDLLTMKEEEIGD